ncbi:IS3 family transposase [Glutamicibacter soli]|uniref:IS3 family transposase n=2 Tax=Micrococcaceae TaxID=1268 RepID=UPI003C777D19
MSSYYAAKQRPPSARSVRDEQLLPKLRAVYEENYSCYGVRKMWHAMNNQHGDQFGTIARCTVERLMKITGIDGCGANGRSLRPVQRTRNRVR